MKSQLHAHHMGGIPLVVSPSDICGRIMHHPHSQYHLQL